jgi:hypothetical protein
MTTMTKFEAFLTEVKTLAAGQDDTLYMQMLTDYIYEVGGHGRHDQLMTISRSLHRALNQRMQELQQLASRSLHAGASTESAVWQLMEQAFAIWKKPFYMPFLSDQIEELTWRSRVLRDVLSEAKKLAQ